MPTHSNTDSHYDQAVALMAQGASIDDMVATLQVSRGEIYHTVRLVFTDFLRRYGTIAAADESAPHLEEWDSLTGALTRRTGEILLLHMLQQSREENPFSIIFIDVDNLKQTNDAYGHKAGDRLLCHLVHMVLGNIRRTDQLIRWAGDEFILALPNTLQTTACETLYRLRRAEPALQFSAGVAQWEPGDSLQLLVDRADQAMYKEKRARKSRQRPPYQLHPGIDRERRVLQSPTSASLTLPDSQSSV